MLQSNRTGYTVYAAVKYLSFPIGFRVLDLLKMLLISTAAESRSSD